jgi:hypothetical protein
MSTAATLRAHAHERVYFGACRGKTLLPVQLNAYRPQMAPNSVDISSTDPTQNIIPQSEVSGTGVHIRVNGDNENTNLVEVTYSCPPLVTMTHLSAAVQVSSTNLQVWTTSTKGSAIIGSNNQGNLTLDGSGNATIWVEATASGTNVLNFLIVSGTTTIGTSSSLNFVNYDSYIDSYSGETAYGGTAKTQQIFNTAQKLYLEGYNIGYYDAHTINATTGSPAYDELKNQIKTGFVTKTALFGYSHGAGATYSACTYLSRDAATLGTFTIYFTGYVDAIEYSGVTDRTAETHAPLGSHYAWNYYEDKAWFIHGAPVPGTIPPPNGLDVNSTSWGANLVHFSHGSSVGIEDSSTVEDDLKKAVESNVPKY